MRLIRTKGDRRLFDDQPSQYLLVILEGSVGDDELHVEFVHPGSGGQAGRLALPGYEARRVATHGTAGLAW